jgi:hypothetical protein
MLAAMTLTTVTGRVRGTVRLKALGAGARVVETSWASDRAFPRTTGAAVAFEIEGDDGAVYRVDPFDALVALPVREAGVRAGVRHEAAWIAVEDQITVEGELERPGPAPPALRARRIAMTTVNGAAMHRLPPRALQRAESEPMQVGPAVVEPATLDASSPVRRPKKKRPDPSGTPTPSA